MIYVMSGGGTKLFAAIGVKFSAGSTLTCTCKENGKVLTAKTTSDQTEYVFAVPNAGTWVVDEVTNNKSEEVSIEKAGQFKNVEFTYALELVKDGVALVSYSTSAANVSTENGAMRVAFNSSSSSGTGIWYLTINVNEYSVLHIDGYYDKYNGGSGTTPTVNIASTYSGTATASATLTTSRASHTIDLTAIPGDANGNAVLSIRAYAYNTDTQGWKSNRAYIYNLWLE